MTGALFDTNILIDNIKAYPQAGDELALYSSPFISRVVWIELLSEARAHDRSILETYLETFRVPEITFEVSAKTVQLRQQYRRLKLPDAMIYATAQVNDLLFVTRNTRDFGAGMPGVRIPYAL